MKELEKTKRISVAAVLTILILSIAILSYKRPEHQFELSAEQALEHIQINHYLVTQSDLENDSISMIDLRSPYDYGKGHLEGAISIPESQILDKNNIDFIKANSPKKELIIYGEHPENCVNTFMILTKLGHKNIKILNLAISYRNNELVITPVVLEKRQTDIQKYIDETVQKAKQKKKKPPVKKKSSPVKIVPKKKKKKMPIEGGC